MKPRDTISAAINSAAAGGRVALVGFLTAGYPSRRQFKDHLAAVMSACDVVEIGVPFSDPMADGTTIRGARRWRHATLDTRGARGNVSGSRCVQCRA